MAWQFEQVAGPFEFTEGPVWDGRHLFFTDFPANRIMRYDPVDGACVVHREGTNGTNGLTLDGAGRLIGCQGDGRQMLRYEDDGGGTVLATHFQGKRLNSPNDVVVDALGRIWFTDPRYGDLRDDMELEHESVFRLDPGSDGNWEIVRMTFDTTSPNGLIVTPDMSTLYVAESKYGETGSRELRAYPINADGTLGDYEVLHNFYPHRGIDGMRLDSEGNIVASAGWEVSGPGPMIYVFAPNGRVLETHPTPSRPTNCCFGDADLGSLYVTGFDGCLWRARTDRRGPDKSG